MTGIYFVSVMHEDQRDGSPHLLCFTSFHCLPSSDVNIRADFVGSFSACYQVGPRGRFSNLRFGATLTFRLTAGF